MALSRQSILNDILTALQTTGAKVSGQVLPLGDQTLSYPFVGFRFDQMVGSLENGEVTRPTHWLISGKVFVYVEQRDFNARLTSLLGLIDTIEVALESLTPGSGTNETYDCRLTRVELDEGGSADDNHFGGALLDIEIRAVA